MNPKLVMGVRILFGLMLLIFGLNKFLNFMPFPPIPGDGGTLMGIYATSGFMSIIGVLEVLGGLALLVNKFVPLSLTVNSAIMFNALVFHLLHDPANTAGAAVGCVLAIILVIANKDRFAGILSA